MIVYDGSFLSSKFCEENRINKNRVPMYLIVDSSKQEEGSKSTLIEKEINSHIYYVIMNLISSHLTQNTHKITTTLKLNGVIHIST